MLSLDFLAPEVKMGKMSWKLYYVVIRLFNVLHLHVRNWLNFLRFVCTVLV
jgi:hypothetical protein